MKRYGPTVHTAVTPDMKTRLEALAVKQDRNPSDVVRAALSAYLRKEESRR